MPPTKFQQSFIWRIHEVKNGLRKWQTNYLNTNDTFHMQVDNWSWIHLSFRPSIACNNTTPFKFGHTRHITAGRSRSIINIHEIVTSCWWIERCHRRRASGVRVKRDAGHTSLSKALPRIQNWTSHGLFKLYKWPSGIQKSRRLNNVRYSSYFLLQ